MPDVVYLKPCRKHRPANTETVELARIRTGPWRHSLHGLLEEEPYEHGGAPGQHCGLRIRQGRRHGSAQVDVKDSWRTKMGRKSR